MAEVKLKERELWKVLEAGLFVLGYTNAESLPGKALTIHWEPLGLTIRHDLANIKPPDFTRPVAELVDGAYTSGQWRE